MDHLIVNDRLLLLERLFQVVNDLSKHRFAGGQSEAIDLGAKPQRVRLEYNGLADLRKQYVAELRLLHEDKLALLSGVLRSSLRAGYRCGEPWYFENVGRLLLCDDDTSNTDWIDLSSEEFRSYYSALTAIFYQLSDPFPHHRTIEERLNSDDQSLENGRNFLKELL